jgi:hypothetical protein
MAALRVLRIELCFSAEGVETGDSRLKQRCARRRYMKRLVELAGFAVVEVVGPAVEMQRRLTRLAELL